MIKKKKNKIYEFYGRWPGASLTMIRGHKHLHECAFIGDDSSEELEELLEVAKETGFLATNNSFEVISFFICEIVEIKERERERERKVTEKFVS